MRLCFTNVDCISKSLLHFVMLPTASVNDYVWHDMLYDCGSIWLLLDVFKYYACQVSAFFCSAMTVAKLEA